MKKCFLCNKDLKQSESSHMKKCAKSFNIEFNKDLLKYNQIQFEYLDILDCSSDNINKLINENGLVLTDFIKIYNLKKSHYYFLIKYHNINIDEKKYKKNVTENRKKTTFEKYGVDSINNVLEIKLKKMKTSIKNYGVDNPSKNIDVINKIKKTKIDKYDGYPNPFKNKSEDEIKKIMNFCHQGFKNMYNNLSEQDKKIMIDNLHIGRKKWWNSLSEDEKHQIINNRTSFKMSKIEKRILDILDYMQIKYIYQFWVNRLSYDFKILNTNVIIEVNGDYWHANPILYHKDQIIKYPNNVKITASEIWYKDFLKKEVALKYGYKILYIWENDMKTYSDVDLINIINNQLIL
jgi:hypothetical protein